MAEKRKRGQNFTVEEKDILVKLLSYQKATILNKKTDGCTNEAKVKSWNEVTNSFNSTATVPRTKDSLIKLWEKLKTESKLHFHSNKKSTTGTGGGPADIKVCPIPLLGRACTGIEGVQDSDADNILNTDENFEVDDNVIIAEIEIHPQEDNPVNDIDAEEQLQKKPKLDFLEEISTPKIPLWSRRRPQNETNSRRRPQICNSNERSENLTTLCSSFTNVNKKKRILKI